jgi:hypothetical protein
MEDLPPPRQIIISEICRHQNCPKYPRKIHVFGYFAGAQGIVCKPLGTIFPGRKKLFVTATDELVAWINGPVIPKGQFRDRTRLKLVIKTADGVCSAFRIGRRLSYASQC